MKFRNTLLFALLAEASVAILGVASYGTTIAGLQATTRFSGRLSLLIFSLIFLFQNSAKVELRRFLSERYYLIFAIAHGIHLAELLGYIYLSGSPLIPYRVAGGFLAYAFIFVMPLIAQQNKSGGRQAARFAVISGAFAYYVCYIFFMTYFSRVQGNVPNAGGTRTQHQVLLGWVVLMFLTRLLGDFVLRKKTLTSETRHHVD